MAPNLKSDDGLEVMNESNELKQLKMDEDREKLDCGLNPEPEIAAKADPISSVTVRRHQTCCLASKQSRRLVVISC